MKLRTFHFTVLMLVVFGCSSCGEGLVVSMDEKVPPTFKYRGNRWAECCTDLNFFVVSEEVDSAESAGKKKDVWWIWPKEGKNGESFNLPAFTYGVVPEGWRQTVPEQGAPPPLIEGKTYQAGGNFDSGQDAHLRFTIRNGNAVWLK